MLGAPTVWEMPGHFCAAASDGDRRAGTVRSPGSNCLSGGCDRVGTSRGPADGKGFIEHLLVRIRERQVEDPLALFGAQGNHRVDSRRATRRDKAGNE